MGYSCIIIDDEPNALNLLEGHITKSPSIILKGKFFDALDALEFLKKERVDLIFTDINMPVLTGLELAEILPRQQKFIFTTAYAEHALSSFSYYVVDYLLKPITFSRFLQAIAKLQLLPVNQPVNPTDSAGNNFMFVKSSGQLVKINFDEITFIKGEKEYVSIHFAKERLLIYKRMKEMESLLPGNFIRVHTSYIVNADRIQKVIANQLLIEKEKIPISTGYREAFLQYLNNKIF